MKVEKRKIVDVKFILTEEDERILCDAFNILGAMDSIITEENLEEDAVEIFCRGRTHKIGTFYITDAVNNLNEII